MVGQMAASSVGMTVDQMDNETAALMVGMMVGQMAASMAGMTAVWMAVMLVA